MPRPDPCIRCDIRPATSECGDYCDACLEERQRQDRYEALADFRELLARFEGRLEEFEGMSNIPATLRADAKQLYAAVFDLRLKAQQEEEACLRK